MRQLRDATREELLGDVFCAVRMRCYKQDKSTVQSVVGQKPAYKDVNTKLRALRWKPLPDNW
jgi:hypothetical protein